MPQRHLSKTGISDSFHERPPRASASTTADRSKIGKPGSATISPERVLNFEMAENLAVGKGEKDQSGIPLIVEGTAANPKILPDVKSMAGSAATEAITGKAGNASEFITQGIEGPLKK
jgi:hypothetical protein